MESYVGSQWLHSRRQYRLDLFGESLDGDASSAVRSLSALALELSLPTKMSPFEKGFVGHLEARIAAILAYHDASARAMSDDLALFAWSGPEQANLVTAITTDIVTIWERSAIRRGVERTFQDLPFGTVGLGDFQLRSVQLVVETASAVCEALQAGHPVETEQDKMDFALLLAHYGPGYVFAAQRGHFRERDAAFHGEDTYQQWLEARSVYRQELFGDLEDALRPPAQRQATFLATVALKQRLDGMVGPYEQHRRSTIAKNVDAILRHHDKRAHSDNQAIFGIVDPDDIPVVAGLTTHVIWLWRRAVARRRVRDIERISDLPFELLAAGPLVLPDFTERQVQMTIEVAAAVCEVLQAGWHTVKIDFDSPNRRYDRQYSHLLGRFIAQRGPEYAKAWIAGEVIRRYGQEHGVNVQPWLDTLPKSTLGRIAVEHIARPIGKVQEVMSHLTTILTNESLMHITGWDKEKVAHVFTGHVLEWIARTEQNPRAAVGRIAKHIDVTLSTDNLSRELGISPARIDKLFPMWVRRGLAWRVSDPIAVARERAILCKKLEQDFPRLPIKLVVRLANSYPDSAHTRAQKVVQELSQHPRDVSEELWAWIVATYPDSGDKRRRRQLVAYGLLQSFRNPHSLDKPPVSGGSRYDMIAGSAIDPAEAVTIEAPWKTLQNIAQKAGVSVEQIEALLTHFSDHKELPDVGQLQAALAKLQSAVKKQDEVLE